MSKVYVTDENDKSFSFEINTNLSREEIMMAVCNKAADFACDFSVVKMPRSYGMYECGNCRKLISSDRAVRDMGLLFCNNECRNEFFEKQQAEDEMIEELSDYVPNRGER